MVNPSSTSPTYQMVDVWFASAYYIWQTGKAKAFPAGLKMKASGSNKLARVVATCDGPYTCERTDNGGCSQICTDTADSFECNCNSGFSLGADQSTCIGMALSVVMNYNVSNMLSCRHQRMCTENS